MARSIVVLGGAGFVGSNIAIYLKKNFPGSKIICADNLKRRGSEIILNRLKENEITFIHLDVRIVSDFDEIKEDVDVVIDACAEPSVQAGISSTPDYVIQTNLLGTVNCLSFAYKKKAQIIFLSTSRVYPIESINEIKFEEQATRFSISQEQSLSGISEKGISENFSLQGYRSFYGTSKLASEYLIEEYHAFYGLQTVINRCGVLTGPWQMGKIDQGVIVLWLARHYFKGKLNYIGFNGSGKQVRDLLHVTDLAHLVKIQIENPNLFNGQVFNVGGGNKVSLSLLELTHLCEEVTGHRLEIGRDENDRAADIRLYISDYSKIEQLCGWSPSITSEHILKDIFEWLKSNESQLKPLLS